jgi:hypothetical protein
VTALNCKRVALAGIAAVETAAEPSLALFARAVRETPLVGMAERVVADRVCGGERFAQIVVRDLERRPRRVTPDTGKAIRLQLDAHRVLVRSFAGRLQPAGANQVLNVVTDLVCDHIRLGEVAGRAGAVPLRCRSSDRCRASDPPGNRMGRRRRSRRRIRRWTRYWQTRRAWDVGRRPEHCRNSAAPRVRIAAPTRPRSTRGRHVRNRMRRRLPETRRCPYQKFQPPD